MDELGVSLGRLGLADPKGAAEALRAEEIGSLSDLKLVRPDLLLPTLTGACGLRAMPAHRILRWVDIEVAKDAGEAAARAAVARAPMSSAALTALGACLEARGTAAALAEAELWHRRAVAQGPTDAAAHANLGLLLLKRQRQPEGGGPSSSAAAAAAAAARVTASVGNGDDDDDGSSANSGERIEALLRRAMELDGPRKGPDGGRAALCLGTWLLEERADPAGGAAAYRVVLDRNPYEADACIGLGVRSYGDWRERERKKKYRGM
jgi:hypothetical protein